ncbi:MAG: 4Fe-4S binding protein [Promethearchaeota archaeon]|nr:MAG: 4Fe-4S binding protein [Candidatus Lokiarchaeota archaeon]
MKAVPYRDFNSRFDRILKRIPALGKLLSSLFGIFEIYIHELFRRFDKKFNIYTMGIVSKYFIKGRWGGRVIPLNKNINLNSKFISSQEILEILMRSNVAGIGWCYCRSVQRKYEKPNCDHPLFSCIHLSFGESLYEIPHKSLNLKRVSKKKIKELLEEFDKRGLIHQLIYFPNPQFYYVICNCCPCCCVVLNKFLKFGSPQMIKSDFIAKTDTNKCIDCGICELWCYFGARDNVDDKLKFDSARCFGCGICISKCPNEAISLMTRK